eukprot:superscaffoldBa00006889_g21997
MVGLMGVEERDEGDRWHGDDRGPNGITKRLEHLGTQGSRLREWDGRLLESSPEVSKHLVEDVNRLEKSRVRVGHCVDACGSQLIRSVVSGGEGFHVDVVSKENY